MINDSSGSGKDNRNLFAGIVEHDARSDLMIICPVWICMPHAMVIMQIRQPTNDLDEVDVAKDDDSRKVKPALADVISQIPKPRFVGCSILGKVRAVVSQTASASIGLKKIQCCNARRVSYLRWENFGANLVLRRTETVLKWFLRYDG